jgi:hypothetical protein
LAVGTRALPALNQIISLLNLYYTYLNGLFYYQMEAIISHYYFLPAFLRITRISDHRYQNNWVN